MLFHNISDCNEYPFIDELLLVDWVLKNGNLKLYLVNYDDEYICFSINTDTVKSRPLESDSEFNVGRLQINKVNQLLDSKNGYYIPPDNFNILMKNEKKDLSMFYGRKESYQFYFIGSVIYLSCPFHRLEDINWEFID